MFAGVRAGDQQHRPTDQQNRQRRVGRIDALVNSAAVRNSAGLRPSSESHDRRRCSHCRNCASAAACVCSIVALDSGARLFSHRSKVRRSAPSRQLTPSPRSGVRTRRTRLQKHQRIQAAARPINAQFRTGPDESRASITAGSLRAPAAEIIGRTASSGPAACFPLWRKPSGRELASPSLRNNPGDHLADHAIYPAIVGEASPPPPVTWPWQLLTCVFARQRRWAHRSRPGLQCAISRSDELSRAVTGSGLPTRRPARMMALFHPNPQRQQKYRQSFSNTEAPEGSNSEDRLRGRCAAKLGGAGVLLTRGTELNSRRAGHRRSGETGRF
jgi:hypothetical protein